MPEDSRLVRLSTICARLPETTRSRVLRHASFHVRKKPFAYYLDDHHGDGIVGVSVNVEPGANEALIAADPTRFYLPAYVGQRGWVGLRLDGEKIDWNEVRALVIASYRLVAPKRLTAALDGE
jgi:hypothetical protein